MRALPPRRRRFGDFPARSAGVRAGDRLFADAAEKSCRSAGIKAGQSAAPLSHLRRQLPLQGSHQTAGARKGSPARGAGCAARRRLRGAAPCGANIRPGHRASVQRRCKSRRSSLCGCGGKVLPPAGIKAGQSAAPLSHLRRQLPLQGSHQTAGARKGSPARGTGCAARRRLKGAAPCGANIRPGRRAGVQRRSFGTGRFAQGCPQAGPEPCPDKKNQTSRGNPYAQTASCHAHGRAGQPLF